MTFSMLSSSQRWYGDATLGEILTSGKTLMAVDVETMNTSLGNEAVSVAIVNSMGNCLFNSLLQTRSPKVIWSGTKIHGITIADMRKAPPRQTTLAKAHSIITHDHPLWIGHTIPGDLKAIEMTVGVDVYDIVKCPHIHRVLVLNGVIESTRHNMVSLRDMHSGLVGGRPIQEGYHSALEGAIATMEVFNCIAKSQAINQVNRM